MDEFIREQHYKMTADDAVKSPELENRLMEYFESLRV